MLERNDAAVVGSIGALGLIFARRFVAVRWDENLSDGFASASRWSVSNDVLKDVELVKENCQSCSQGRGQ